MIDSLQNSLGRAAYRIPCPQGVWLGHRGRSVLFDAAGVPVRLNNTTGDGQPMVIEITAVGTLAEERLLRWLSNGSGLEIVLNHTEFPA